MTENLYKKSIIVSNTDELRDFAQVFLSELEVKEAGAKGLHAEASERAAVIIGLSGDLGAGKTTFSKSAAALLGVEEVVTSPTFGIQKQYLTKHPIFKEFVHIDAYRIEEIRETEPLRFIELFQKPNTLIFIEWPEKIAEVLPKETIMVSFESINENTRKISY